MISLYAVHAAYAVGASILACYVVWILYLAIMHLIRAREYGTLKKTARWLGYPVVLVGIILDWLLNVIVGTVLFLEMPKSFGELVTARLKRHCNLPTWRGAIAWWVCHKLLNTFDPSGRHCD